MGNNTVRLCDEVTGKTRMLFSSRAKAIMRLTQHFSWSLWGQKEGISAVLKLTAEGLSASQKREVQMRIFVAANFSNFPFFVYMIL